MTPLKSFRKDFEPFGKNVWLNAASEGPLPKVSARALREAVAWKSLPHRLTTEKFMEVPRQLKDAIGMLLAVNAREVILADSASYGIHLLANGIPWRSGDEIALMQNDFPTNILPWLALTKKGVKVHQLRPAAHTLRPEELESRITPKTRLLCLSHVHTFSGHSVDLEGFSRLCRRHKIIFVLNVSQSVGTMPLDFSGLKVDAIVSAGYKWLCGPYGTGFCWIKPELRDQLDLNRAYWIASMGEHELQEEKVLTLKDLRSARKYDVFGTANFFNFVPFNRSIRYILDVGLDRIRAHNQSLIDRLIAGLPASYELISPREGAGRSNLVFLSHRDSQKNTLIYRNLLAKGVFPGFWKGKIRVCPHLYNNEAEVDRLLGLLRSSG